MKAIRREFPDLPPVWAAGTALAVWLASEVVPILRFQTGATTLAGGAFVLAGLVLIGWSALWFHRKQTTIEPRQAPRALIVEGPFRLNRNPIYTGMALAIVGVALWLGTLGGVVVALAFPPIVTARFIRGEETALRAAFGAEADDYLARSRRW